MSRAHSPTWKWPHTPQPKMGVSAPLKKRPQETEAHHMYLIHVFIIIFFNEQVIFGGWWESIHYLDNFYIKHLPCLSYMNCSIVQDRVREVSLDTNNPKLQMIKIQILSFFISGKLMDVHTDHGLLPTSQTEADVMCRCWRNTPCPTVLPREGAWVDQSLDPAAALRKYRAQRNTLEHPTSTHSQIWTPGRLGWRVPGEKGLYVKRDVETPQVRKMVRTQAQSLGYTGGDGPEGSRGECWARGVGCSREHSRVGKRLLTKVTITRVFPIGEFIRPYVCMFIF